MAIRCAQAFFNTEFFVVESGTFPDCGQESFGNDGFFLLLDSPDDLIVESPEPDMAAGIPGVDAGNGTTVLTTNIDIATLQAVMPYIVLTFVVAFHIRLILKQLR